MRMLITIFLISKNDALGILLIASGATNKLFRHFFRVVFKRLIHRYIFYLHLSARNNFLRNANLARYAQSKWIINGLKVETNL